MNLSASRILIAGVGNVLYGDDAFGCEVARRLAEQPLPENVRVIDFGIRGFDLATALLEPHDIVLIVDCLIQGEQPGALRVFDSQRDLTVPLLLPGYRPLWHSIDPATALNLAHSLGGRPGRVIVVGCEPGRSGEPAVPQIGMTQAVQAAVHDAVRLIVSLVTQLNQRAGQSVFPVDFSP